MRTFHIHSKALVKTVLLGLAVLSLGAFSKMPTFGEVQEINEMPELISISGTEFLSGSTPAAREMAYNVDEFAYGTPITREQNWYEFERPRTEKRLRRFLITKTPITNFQYAAFLRETGHASPDVDEVEWLRYGVNHSFQSTRKYAWTEDGLPLGREMHPVVLVSKTDAEAYAAWLTEKTGRYWRLPLEDEWELAARGTDGRAYPWGDSFNPTHANTADVGPFDTMPVGSFPTGASPFGVLDMAGQVYEWTSTPGERNRYVVKGGSWDDKGCGVCRVGARHHREADMKHIIIGFRLVQVPN